MPQSDIDDVVGFDLGHGETCVVRMSLQPRAVPQIMRVYGKTSQITAVGYSSGAGIVVGERALCSETVHDRQFGFKQKPPGTPASRKALGDFVRKYHEILTSQKKIAGGERTHFFVGCPSGWSALEMDEYRKLLQSALPKVSVVRESRAALVQAKEDANTDLTLAELRSAILVVDIGSLTTDVSYVVGGIHDQTLDTGMELGGSMIDREILRRAVARSSNRAELEALFGREGGEIIRAMCEVHCRQAKERFCQGQEDSDDETFKASLRAGKDGPELVMALSAEEIESILTSPLPELDGATWLQTLGALLDRVLGTMAARGVSPALLVLTGGVMNMPAVRRFCEQRLPGVKSVPVPAPEETVALGLARWGVIQLRTSAFSEEVQQFCDTVVPAVVADHSARLQQDLAEALAKEIVAELVVPVSRSWRDGELHTLDSMKGAMQARLTSWAQSPACAATVQRACAVTLGIISREIDNRTGEICRRHDIPQGSLQLGLHFKLKDGMDVPMEMPFDTAMSIVGGIVFVVLFILTGIAKAALFEGLAAGGPPGWLVGGLFTAMAAFFGLGFLDDKLKAVDMPLVVRRNVLSDHRLEKLSKDLEAKLTNELKAVIGDEKTTKIGETITQQVTEFLTARANDVKWIIAPSEWIIAPSE